MFLAASRVSIAPFSSNLNWRYCNESQWKYTDSEHDSLRCALCDSFRGLHLGFDYRQRKPHQLARICCHDWISFSRGDQIRCTFMEAAKNCIGLLRTSFQT